ncbi:hypothetical protein, partial [Sphingomonas ursincola]|uniref:hypothetical protein n=1 Tax=Sphingomonas ursincola TaxID=56361 RepID=UPI00235448FD
MIITDTRLKTILLSGAALGSLAMPAAAFAQDAAQDAENADSNVIIVTASKRETTLQEGRVRQCGVNSVVASGRHFQAALGVI